MTPSPESIDQFTKYNQSSPEKIEDTFNLEAVELLTKEYAAWQAKQSWNELEIDYIESELVDFKGEPEKEEEMKQDVKRLRRELEEIKKEKIACSKKLLAYKSTPAYQEQVLKNFQPQGREN